MEEGSFFLGRGNLSMFVGTGKASSRTEIRHQEETD